MTVIDIHTHMLTDSWLDLLAQHGGPKYDVKPTKAGERTIWLYGAPFMTLQKGMFDYEMRIENMNKAKVDVAIVSLTCPNAYFGDADISLKAAQIVNDSMSAAQTAYPDRIRWFTSLPWQYPELAKKELERTMKAGAVGVMVIANIDGKNLTDPLFAPTWKEIDKLGLPVLVHPTAPQGVQDMHMDEYGLVPPVGFMIDTTLAISRMIFDGFFDKYPNVKIIASHGGATLPYIAGRLDQCHAKIPACSEVIKDKPSSYLKKIYYDSVVYDTDALNMCIKVAGGPEMVMYGSDYPHNIGDMAGCLSRVNALPAAQARMVAGSNAERIFKL